MLIHYWTMLRILSAEHPLFSHAGENDMKNKNDSAPALRCEALVRPPGFPPQVWTALQEIRTAQKRLEDDYPQYNESGKHYAIESASSALRHAHAQIMHYVAEVADITAQRFRSATRGQP